MNTIEIHFASGSYDRVRPLLDGRVPLRGFTFRHTALPPEQLFPRAIRGNEFDLFELSFSGFLRRLESGQNDLIGLPIFLSRAFRHSAVYIRKDRVIHSPHDLKNRSIGVPDYAMTGAVWVRGLLKHDYGVDPKDVSWRTGGLHHAGHSTLGVFNHPDLDIKPISNSATLSDLLASGEIDALISSDTPRCFIEGHPHVGRLFPNFREVEQSYWARTKLFPIMHLLVVRRRTFERHPHVIGELLPAFDMAKRIAIQELSELTSLQATLPWAPYELAETRRLMGDDFWSYGSDPNRSALETFLSYTQEQGILRTKMSVEQCFSAT
jgi:4,5-dihydroxyphthalate decarboxylase